MPAILEDYLAKLSPRDRVAVIVLAIFVVISCVGLAVLKLHRAADKAQQQAEQEKELYTWLQASMPLLAGGASINGGSVLDTVSASAGVTGITMQRFEPDGDSVRVWLENAEFAKVANWLHSLSQQGINAQEVHFEQNSKGLSVRLVFGR
ncbi:type II secretion system protein GspM [Agitococcus lubricus]|uniref:Type II secretory pathway component PulM n=1 Tax=Agitococcus lubricus TaxID=1077255 RepID=A0A2T5IWK1_9GAMM|nr:type II secretion system protein GspM [Agitococcus lubricus]PTQ88286.1 type II secretory pathway component PulM [Agitococcus lubricus]